MGNELWVPIVMFICLAVVFGLHFLFRFRARAEMQATVRAALDKGHELTPELIERLGQPKSPPHGDLRRAVIWIAAGIGLVAFGFILGEEDAERPLAAMAAFPIAIGIAYLIISRFGEDASN